MKKYDITYKLMNNSNLEIHQTTIESNSCKQARITFKEENPDARILDVAISLDNEYTPLEGGNQYLTKRFFQNNPKPIGFLMHLGKKAIIYEIDEEKGCVYLKHDSIYTTKYSKHPKKGELIKSCRKLQTNEKTGEKYFAISGPRLYLHNMVLYADIKKEIEELGL